MSNFQDEIQKAIAARRAAIGHNLGLDPLEKGGKRANIGEVRTHHGRQMIKTASGWRPYSTGGKHEHLRGGETPPSSIIGKTSSGKDIHSDHLHPSHSDFSAQDHYEAGNIHNEQTNKMHEEGYKKHPDQPQWKVREDLARGDDKYKKINEKREHHYKIYRLHSDIEYYQKQHKDHEEGTVGKTKGGKPIHDTFDHPGNAKLSKRDHAEAETNHGHRASVESMKEQLKHPHLSQFSPEFKEILNKNEKYQHHIKQEQLHAQAVDAPKAPKAEKKQVSHEDNLKSALKKRFKDPEDEDHHDDVHHHLKEHLKANTPKSAHKEIDSTPWMEDEMFGGGDHKHVGQTMNHVKETIDDLKSRHK